MSLLHNLRSLLQNQIKCATYLQSFRNSPCRHYSDEDSVDPIPSGLKTTTTPLSHDLPSTLFVKSYNDLGFVFTGGIQVFGPCIVFPKSVLHWSVRDARDINEDSLSLFTLLEPKLDILVLGVGDQKAMANIDPQAIIALRKLRINLEILTTDLALQTFNYLNSENRYIGGAFIPAVVEKQFISENDLMKGQATDPAEVDESFWESPNREELPLVHRLPRQLFRKAPEHNTEEIQSEARKELFKDPPTYRKKKK